MNPNPSSAPVHKISEREPVPTQAEADLANKIVHRVCNVPFKNYGEANDHVAQLIANARAGYVEPISPPTFTKPSPQPSEATPTPRTEAPISSAPDGAGTKTVETDAMLKALDKKIDPYSDNADVLEELADFARKLEQQRDALKRGRDEAVLSEVNCRQIIDTYVSETDDLRATLAKTQEALETLRASYEVSCQHRADLTASLAQAQREKERVILAASFAHGVFSIIKVARNDFQMNAVIEAMARIDAARSATPEERK